MGRDVGMHCTYPQYFRKRRCTGHSDWDISTSPHNQWENRNVADLATAILPLLATFLVKMRFLVVNNMTFTKQFTA